MLNNNTNIMRIIEIELNNYKNVQKGNIVFDNIDDILSGKSSITGIYGQNGSGKTSIITAISVIKDILMGKPLPEDILNYITFGESTASIDLLFFHKVENREYKVQYILDLEKVDNSINIARERISYWFKNEKEKRWNRVKHLIDSNYNKSNVQPLIRYDELVKLFEEDSDFIVAKKICLKENRSFIFSYELARRIYNNMAELGNEYEIIVNLINYARESLFIIDNRYISLSSANLILPMNIKNYGEDISLGIVPIGLEEPVFLPKIAIDEVKKSLESSNKVISEIIPGLKIELKELMFQTSKEGEEEVSVELISCRGDRKIPIKYESDGIKKIVSVIHLLVAMYNNSSMTVLIDELDSGIFEYLLGEIIEILETRGKGQLIFTSHNLRPLEVLSKDSLVFTTTNENNRYIRLKNVKTNNNVRDMYYRDMILGGQDEEIYVRTNSAKISRSFRKAGE